MQHKATQRKVYNLCTFNFCQYFNCYCLWNETLQSKIFYLYVLADLDMTHNLGTFTWLCLFLILHCPFSRSSKKKIWHQHRFSKSWFIDDPPIEINYTRSSLGTKGEQSVYKSQIHHSLDFLMYRKLSSCFCCCVDYTLFFRLF